MCLNKNIDLSNLSRISKAYTATSETQALTFLRHPKGQALIDIVEQLSMNTQEHYNSLASVAFSPMGTLPDPYISTTRTMTTPEIYLPAAPFIKEGAVFYITNITNPSRAQFRNPRMINLSNAVNLTKAFNAEHPKQFGVCLTFITTVSGIIETFENLAQDIPEGFKEHKILSFALQTTRHHKLRAFINESSNAICIVTNKSPTVQMYHKVMASLVAVLPDVANRVKDKFPEDLYLKLVEEDSSSWLDLLVTWYESWKQDLSALRRKETVAKLKELTSKETQRQLENTTRRIQEVEDRLYELYRIRNLTMLALYAEQGTDLTSLEEFLAHAKNTVRLFEITPNAQSLKATVSTVYKHYDPKLIEKALMRSEGTMLTSLRQRVSREDFEVACAVIKEVFLDYKYALVLQGTFQVLLQDCTLQNPQQVTEAARNLDAGLPNPHIADFNCYTHAKELMLKCLAEKDWIGFLNQAIAAVADFNMLDYPVACRFFEKTFCIEYRECTEFKAFKDPQGNMYTAAELMQKYKDSLKGGEASGTSNTVDESND